MTDRSNKEPKAERNAKRALYDNVVYLLRQAHTTATEDALHDVVLAYGLLWHTGATRGKKPRPAAKQEESN